MQDFIVVIPARYASTRLPGKPLADIAGRPMVARVWDLAKRSLASRVVIATDDPRIEQTMSDLGAEVVMTRADHSTGTDRLAEVVDLLHLNDEAVLVNVQGDEPLLPPELVNQVAIRLMRDEGASVATLAESIGDVDTLFNANVVKVTRAASGRALTFTRAPMPWDREGFREPPSVLTTDAWLRHIGLYAYRASFLRAYSEWLPAPIEQLEQLEQLRALHYGHAIQVALAEQTPGAGVDTEEDLARVRAHFEQRARGATP
ncbi:3-deoxy-manno-octulosonate cytidylyltransferase [Halomonas sp. DP8Y7-3]|uniref:3-deoxy-manno-octulosonate cytidylyltransferase n=1 Tax=Halomonas sp. DP8Y7-3 TaxID=2859079 RepID=UPI001C955750|nr:3-deoxy-manno-octulosonate cytidylyltransferase [Halomonas sp. DP8Y7-3]MBY5930560.1 3-deoxy-manno-octulosonate cytidylyltransferase [Halomonas sp. DP8Y7-3]